MTYITLTLWRGKKVQVTKYKRKLDNVVPKKQDSKKEKNINSINMMDDERREAPKDIKVLFLGNQRY